MKRIAHCLGGRRGSMGLLGGLLFAGVIFAQTTEMSSPTSGSPGVIGQYLQEHQTLDQEWQTLVSQGATQAQLDAWQQQNAPAFEFLQQLAQAVAVASALHPLPLMEWEGVPANASPALQDYLMTRVTLLNAFARIHNQLLQGIPSNATQGNLDSMHDQEQQMFIRQNAANLQLQDQQAQAVAAESPSVPLPILGPPVIPSNASPQLRAYLRARSTLLNAQAQVWNQYLTADPAVAEAAMQEWTQQNAASIQQVDQLAQNLANSTATQ
jgi:hypothetical protein